MRTTISIEDSLLQKAKKISHERRCSLRTVIEDALRAAFAKEHKRTRSDAPRPLKTFKGTGVQPGIDLCSSTALLDAMILLDVNILVSAHRADADQHREIKSWLEGALSDPAGVGISELALSGCLRVITHPKVFKKPTPLAQAIDFVEDFRSREEVHVLGPGAGHWKIFVDLCRRSDARGNLVPDAFHAALAIELGCEWLTLDRGFARFRGLKWRHPLD